MNKYLIICLSFFLYSINSFSQSDPYTPYLDIEISVDSTNTDTSDKLIEDLFSISLSDDELNDDTSASDNISGLLNSVAGTGAAADEGPGPGPGARAVAAAGVGAGVGLRRGGVR